MATYNISLRAESHGDTDIIKWTEEAKTPAKALMLAKTAPVARDAAGDVTLSVRDDEHELLARSRRVEETVGRDTQGHLVFERGEWNDDENI